jgi:hypothetical protein
MDTQYFVMPYVIRFVFPNRFEMALGGTALRGGFSSYTTYIVDDNFLALK